MKADLLSVFVEVVGVSMPGQSEHGEHGVAVVVQLCCCTLAAAVAQEAAEQAAVHMLCQLHLGEEERERNVL